MFILCFNQWLVLNLFLEYVPLSVQTINIIVKLTLLYIILIGGEQKWSKLMVAWLLCILRVITVKSGSIEAHRGLNHYSLNWWVLYTFISAAHSNLENKVIVHYKMISEEWVFNLRLERSCYVYLLILRMWVRTPAGRMLCPWARHFTLTCSSRPRCINGYQLRLGW